MSSQVPSNHVVGSCILDRLSSEIEGCEVCGVTTRPRGGSRVESIGESLSLAHADFVGRLHGCEFDLIFPRICHADMSCKSACPSSPIDDVQGSRKRPNEDPSFHVGWEFSGASVGPVTQAINLFRDSDASRRALQPKVETNNERGMTEDVHAKCLVGLFRAKPFSFVTSAALPWRSCAPSLLSRYPSACFLCMRRIHRVVTNFSTGISTYPIDWDFAIISKGLCSIQDFRWHQHVDRSTRSDHSGVHRYRDKRPAWAC